MPKPNPRALVGALLIPIVSACSAAPASDAADPANHTFAFTDVTVLPMDSERVLDGQTVIVRDGVITAVGPADRTPVPEGAIEIDGRGRYLMPGLAEMHAHVPPVPAGSDARPPQDQLDDILFLYVANGITTIRGMLGSSYQLALRDELFRDELLGPAFYVGAPSLNGNTAPTPDDAERMVRAAAEAGYDLQKIHPGVPLDAWDRMVAVAEEVGLTFGGHVPADVGIEHALETGMSTVDHLDGFIEGAASDALAARAEAGESVGLPELMADLDENKLMALARRAAEAGTYVVPTAYLWENLYGSPDVDARLSQPEMSYVSHRQREAWRAQAGRGPTLAPAVREAFFDARRRMCVSRFAVNHKSDDVDISLENVRHEAKPSLTRRAKQK